MFRLNLAQTCSLVGVALALASPAWASDKPAVDALKEFREGRSDPKAIENRFFLKKGRFETALHLGLVPNNSFSQRYVGGLILAYHLNETVAVGADITYAPDLGKTDLKPLVGILLDKAANTGTQNASFQQPLDKVTLAASFGLTWSPVYGKINLIGETVLNFDVYGYLGIGMVSLSNYSATYDPSGAGGSPNDVVQLQQGGNEVRVAPALGIGQNYFLTQTIALKLDAKASFYLDDEPQYDPNVPPSKQQLYNNFVVSIGIGAFLPKMKPRLYDF